MSAAEPDGRVLRQRLRVVALEGDDVLLAGARASACGRCAARAGCGTGALAEMIGGSQQLRLPRPLPLAVGDEVVVVMEGGAFLGAAFRAYLLPPAALAVTAVLAAAFGLNDAVTAALCLPVLALSLWPLARAESRARRRSALRIEGRASERCAP